MTRVDLVRDDAIAASVAGGQGWEAARGYWHARATLAQNPRISPWFRTHGPRLPPGRLAAWPPGRLRARPRAMRAMGYGMRAKRGEATRGSVCLYMSTRASYVCLPRCAYPVFLYSCIPAPLLRRCRPSLPSINVLQPSARNQNGRRFRWAAHGSMDIQRTQTTTGTPAHTRACPLQLTGLGVSLVAWLTGDSWTPGMAGACLARSAAPFD